MLCVAKNRIINPDINMLMYVLMWRHCELSRYGCPLLRKTKCRVYHHEIIIIICELVVMP